MSEPASGLRDHLGYWLRRLSDEVHLSFERKLAAHGITVAQWNVLVTLYRGEGQAVAEVARFIETDAAAVSRLVDRLGEKGLVARSPDPASRRLGKFQLLEPVGQGAFGVVWKACDTELDRTVALKIPHTGVAPPRSERRCAGF